MESLDTRTAERDVERAADPEDAPEPCWRLSIWSVVLYNEVFGILMTYFVGLLIQLLGFGNAFDAALILATGLWAILCGLVHLIHSRVLIWITAVVYVALAAFCAVLLGLNWHPFDSSDSFVVYYKALKIGCACLIGVSVPLVLLNTFVLLTSRDDRHETPWCVRMAHIWYIAFEAFFAIGFALTSVLLPLNGMNEAWAGVIYAGILLGPELIETISELVRLHCECCMTAGCRNFSFCVNSTTSCLAYMGVGLMFLLIIGLSDKGRAPYTMWLPFMLVFLVLFIGFNIHWMRACCRWGRAIG